MLIRPYLPAAAQDHQRTANERTVTVNMIEITRKPVLSLTDRAAAKVADLLVQEGEDRLALRVAVRPGGCSGFSYEIFFDADVDPDDDQATFGTVKVVVDPASARQIRGATLDYKDGLQGAGFHIDNPNAQRSCGCGQSFS